MALLAEWHRTVILGGFSAYCSLLAPEFRQHFLIHYWLTFLAGFAGGPLSALLMMTPDKAPITLVTSNVSIGIWTLVWWLMNYSPLAPLLTRIHSIKPVKMMTKGCVAYCRAQMIIGRINLAASMYPGVVLGPILIATVSASAGKFTFDAIRHVYGLPQGPAEITVPSYSFRSAFLGSSLYFFLAVFPVTQVLGVDQAALALITLFVAHSLLSDLAGRPLDWSAALLWTILRVAGIPWPTGVPSPLKAGAASLTKHVQAKPAASAPPSQNTQSMDTRFHTLRAEVPANGFEGKLGDAPPATAPSAARAAAWQDADSVSHAGPPPVPSAAQTQHNAPWIRVATKGKKADAGKAKKAT
mmetsp:Transcript_14438/g.25198  ORF Transcript_14438/g.25198 Transcript_14438/m.25198 type:complete len:356 (+) Transcript_14438:76-1143(+)